MLLYMVRHAWAFERDEQRWPDDGHRPLTKEGKRRFARVASRLARRGLEPAVIATSPLVRCRQTADILARKVPGDPPIVELEALAPDSDLDTLLHWTAQQEAPAVAWVGHAPDVGLLTARLIGGEQGQINFRKGAVAAIELNPQAGTGELLWLATAKVLGG